MMLNGFGTIGSFYYNNYNTKTGVLSSKAVRRNRLSIFVMTSYKAIKRKT